MKKLTYVLLFVTSTLGAQEVRAPQRGEERREPRVERPEPVRVQPQPESPRQEQPLRPQPRPDTFFPPGRVPVGYVDPFFGPRNWRGNPWIMMQMDFNRRPNRIEMAPLRQRWENLTSKQREKLLELRKEYREKVQKIINNP